MMDDAKLIRETTARLIDWCAEVRRPLPWRLSPTPYHVWVSEIMLQQTRIEAVIPYYARFLDALPETLCRISRPLPPSRKTGS